MKTLDWIFGDVFDQINVVVFMVVAIMILACLFWFIGFV